MTTRTKKLKMEEEQKLQEQQDKSDTESEKEQDSSETEPEDKKRKTPAKPLTKKVAAKPSVMQSKSGPGEKKEESPMATLRDDFNEPKVTAEQIKIISWNVAGFKAVLGKGFNDYVEEEDADIYCLQETKIEPSAIKKDQLPKGYEYHFIGADKKGHHGTGLLTKKKPLSVKFGIGIEKHDNEGRVITAEYDGFYLINSYIPNAGTKGLQRLDYRIKEWDVDFQAYLEKLDQTKPIIWCGDLNVAHTEIDLKNPKTNTKSAGFTIEERTSFSNFLAKGYVDSYRHFNPGKVGSYTFWSYMGGARSKNVGWRLDYFIVSKRFLESNIKSTPFHRTSVMGSDHCPIGVVVNL